MTDYTLLALTHLFALLVGMFVGEEILTDWKARKDCICPVSLGRTEDDGTATNH